MENLENILAHRIKTYLNSISIETEFHYRSSKDVWTIIVYLPNNSKGWYTWTSIEKFLLGDYSVFRNNVFKNVIPYSDYLISDSLEELNIKMYLMGI
jgi:hypothetical protein